MSGKSRIKPSSHIVWSTGEIDLNEVARLLDDLDLPSEVYHLWKAFLEKKKNMLKGKGILTRLQKGILLNALRRALGKDYLERIEKRVQGFHTEVIIAVENIAQNGGENHE